MGDRKRKLDVAGGDYYQQPATTSNPHTGRPYSRKYYDILAKRKGMFLDHVILVLKFSLRT